MWSIGYTQLADPRFEWYITWLHLSDMHVMISEDTRLFSWSDIWWQSCTPVYYWEKESL